MPAVTLQLNWKADPEFGGFFAAQLNGDFEKRGINVKVVEGGVGAPTIQMVGSGSVEFAIVSADEVLIARARGNHVVPLFAVYQICPQGLMAHAERGFKEIGDIFGQSGTVAMEKGLPYVKFLQNKYKFDKVTVVEPSGDLSLFRSGANVTQQCFVTSEPIAAKRAGIETRTFLIADAGYNPYTAVMVTSEAYFKANPALVKAVVGAVRDGWAAYLANPGPANTLMQNLNPSMDAETFAAAAAAQKPLIETEETKAHGLGSMNPERWDTLAKQLVELGVIEKAPSLMITRVVPAPQTQPAKP
ncbi:MAG: ABC transporter substrate-binding protein [Planctomycetes bacterium]|nr:ABC transporter substrate-binding protein [Planctomycetota bacterium]